MRKPKHQPDRPSCCDVSDLLNEMYFVVEARLRARILEQNARLDPALLEAALAAGRTRVATSDGALPPDLSMLVKARENGARYVYSILTGFGGHPPAGFKLPEGKYYNPYFEGWAIGMPNTALGANAVTYSDGTKATIEQEAHDVVTFLAWASEPKMEERKRAGFSVLSFLVAFSVILFFAYRRVWRDQH